MNYLEYTFKRGISTMVIIIVILVIVTTVVGTVYIVTQARVSLIPRNFPLLLTPSQAHQVLGGSWNVQTAMYGYLSKNSNGYYVVPYNGNPFKTGSLYFFPLPNKMNINPLKAYETTLRGTLNGVTVVIVSYFAVTSYFNLTLPPKSPIMGNIRGYNYMVESPSGNGEQYTEVMATNSHDILIIIINGATLSKTEIQQLISIELTNAQSFSS